MSRVDLRAQLLKCSDMEIHGPRADGAAAGKRNAGAAETRDKRSKRQDGRAHRFYEFIRRDRVVESGCFHHVIRRGEISREFVKTMRSEEHTSELQSPCNLVCRLLLEKKKKRKKTTSKLRQAH